MAKIKACEFYLLRVVDFQLFEYPVVERAIILKFQSTDRVGNPFDRISKAMGKVIHRIDAPLVASPVVSYPPDAIEGRVTHI